MCTHVTLINAHHNTAHREHMCAFSVWPKIHITHPMIDQCLDAFHMAIGARLCSCEKNTSHSHSRTTTALTDQNTRISRATPRIAVTLCNTVSMRQAWCYCAKCVCVCVCVCACVLHAAASGHCIKHGLSWHSPRTM